MCIDIFYMFKDMENEISMRFQFFDFAVTSTFWSETSMNGYMHARTRKLLMREKKKRKQKQFSKFLLI